MGATFSLRKMVTPAIIQLIYWIGSLLLFAAGVFLAVAGAAEIAQYDLGVSYDLLGTSGYGTLIAGIALALLGPLVLRVLCEAMILFFRMNERLNDIHGEVRELRLAMPSGNELTAKLDNVRAELHEFTTAARNSDGASQELYERLDQRIEELRDEVRNAHLAARRSDDLSERLRELRDEVARDIGLATRRGEELTARIAALQQEIQAVNSAATAATNGNGATETATAERSAS